MGDKLNKCFNYPSIAHSVPFFQIVFIDLLKAHVNVHAIRKVRRNVYEHRHVYECRFGRRNC
jgi:hypothetical protein